ncbi:hypothetical protein DICVIV_11573 [Dictyocaulus viviparus]|uniref:Uncharacterized protein n=1 Tax=Dictyocaulus viviparus TaxID=29172 RepID=A0A0D8XFB5_DICVI|nr:hypothetical protein DICVIV_11573 [Dictyocaulus viviparus]
MNYILYIMYYFINTNNFILYRLLMFMNIEYVADAPFTLNGENISERSSYEYLGRECIKIIDLISSEEFCLKFPQKTEKP